jgi:hypothetical protein
MRNIKENQSDSYTCKYSFSLIRHSSLSKPIVTREEKKQKMES